MSTMFDYLRVAVHTPGVFSIVGSGGTGKTTLAEAVARKAALVQSMMSMDGKSNLPYAKAFSLNPGEGPNMSELFSACALLNIMLTPAMLTAMAANVIKQGDNMIHFQDLIGDAVDNIISSITTLIDRNGITMDNAELFSSSKEELSSLKTLLYWVDNRDAGNITGTTPPFNMDWTYLVNFIARDLFTSVEIMETASIIGDVITSSAGHLSLLATEMSSSGAGVRVSAIDFDRDLWEFSIGNDFDPVIVKARASQLVIALSYFSVVHVSTVSSAITDSIGATLSGGLDEGVGFFIQRINDTVVNCGGIAIIESRDDFSTKTTDPEQKRQMLNRLGSSSKVSIMLHSRGQSTMRMRRYSNVRNDSTKEFIEPELTRDFAFNQLDVREFLGSDVSQDEMVFSPLTAYDEFLINGLAYFEEKKYVK